MNKMISKFTKDCTDKVPEELTEIHLDNLVVEPYVPKRIELAYPHGTRRDKVTRRTRFYFDQSLARLRKEGYTRHLRPAEAMRISFKYNNGRNDLDYGVQAAIRESEEIQIIREASSRGIIDSSHENLEEWISAAFLRMGKNLFVHIDPENIIWKRDQGYIIDGNTTPYKFRFEIPTKFDEDYDECDYKDNSCIISAGELPKELVKLLFGRTFTEFPRMFKSGCQNTGILIPPENKIVIASWVMGTFSFGYISQYTIAPIKGYVNTAVSRGVRECNEKK